MYNDLLLERTTVEDRKHQQSDINFSIALRAIIKQSLSERGITTIDVPSACVYINNIAYYISNGVIYDLDPSDMINSVEGIIDTMGLKEGSECLLYTLDTYKDLEGKEKIEIRYLMKEGIVSDLYNKENELFIKNEIIKELGSRHKEHKESGEIEALVNNKIINKPKFFNVVQCEVDEYDMLNNIPLTVDKILEKVDNFKYINITNVQLNNNVATIEYLTV